MENNILDITKNHVLFGDCIELMKKIPSKSVNLILCDLPFGVTNHEKDIVIPYDLLWKEYNRIITDNGKILLFAQGIFYVDLVNSNRKMFRYDIVWDKVLTTGFLNAKHQPLRSHEQIAVFYKKGNGTYNPQFTEGEPLHGRGTSYMDKEQVNQNYGEFKTLEDTRKGTTQKYPKSVLTFKKPHPSVAKHRTEKPVELLNDLVLTYSNESDIVLDNCCGSGGVGEVCMLTNRKYILMDNDEKYIKITERRIIDFIKKIIKI